MEIVDIKNKINEISEMLLDLSRKIDELQVECSETEYKNIPVNKVINCFDPVCIDILEATLLSTDEVELLPREKRVYHNWWWLRSPGRIQGRVASILTYGNIDDLGNAVYYDCGAIRPALKISNLKSTNFKIGDSFTFGGKEFKIISENLAFCTTDIGLHRFDATSNDYEKSEVKKYVDEWFKSAING